MTDDTPHRDPDNERNDADAAAGGPEPLRVRAVCPWCGVVGAVQLHQHAVEVQPAVVLITDDDGFEGLCGVAKDATTTETSRWRCVECGRASNETDVIRATRAHPTAEAEARARRPDLPARPGAANVPANPARPSTPTISDAQAAALALAFRHKYPTNVRAIGMSLDPAAVVPALRRALLAVHERVGLSVELARAGERDLLNYRAEMLEVAGNTQAPLLMLTVRDEDGRTVPEVVYFFDADGSERIEPSAELLADVARVFLDEGVPAYAVSVRGRPPGAKSSVTLVVAVDGPEDGDELLRFEQGVRAEHDPVLALRWAHTLGVHPEDVSEHRQGRPLFEDDAELANWRPRDRPGADGRAA